MKKLLLIVAAMLLASPAMAGELDYNNGSVTWNSKGCQQPTPPDFVSGDAEQLNINVRAFNDYSNAVKKYLDCVNAEATSDLTTINQRLTSQLQATANQWQTMLNQLSDQLNQQRGP